MRLQDVRDRLAQLGFETELGEHALRARQGGLELVVDLVDPLIGDRNPTVLIRMPRPGDEPFAFRVHAQDERLPVILDLLAQTGGSLMEGDPAPFAGLAKVAGLTWFVEP
jgi:hypothetical protein